MSAHACVGACKHLLVSNGLQADARHLLAPHAGGSKRRLLCCSRRAKRALSCPDKACQRHGRLSANGIAPSPHRHRLARMHAVLIAWTKPQTNPLYPESPVCTATQANHSIAFLPADGGISQRCVPVYPHPMPPLVGSHASWQPGHASHLRLWCRAAERAGKGLAAVAAAGSKKGPPQRAQRPRPAAR